jgi:pimeloyl-ACP methyl ester carboxylesterase
MEADEYGACSKKGVEQILQLLPGIQYIKIPGSNHSVHNVTINEFLHVLHEFLRQCCATGAASL